MEDYLTKTEFKERSADVDGQLLEIRKELQKQAKAATMRDGKIDNIEQELQKQGQELQKQGVMAEQRDDKLDVIIEMLGGNLEKTSGNSVGIKENREDIKTNKLHIQNLQEVVK